MIDPIWYTRFFGEDYLRVHEPYLFPERTKQELIGILTLLGSAQPPLAEGSAVLDLCCGQGRHSIPLAALGYRVTGLDLSSALLAHAREIARQSRIAVNWIQSDMRRIPARDEFDAALNIFNTFGYLESEDEDLKVLEEVRAALKPGGLFLLETVGRDTLVRHFTPAAVDRHADGLLVAQEQAFDQLTSRLEVRVTLVELDGARREYEQSIRIYTPTELVRLCERARLSVEGVYGSLDGSDLTLDSPRLVILARRAT